MVTHGETDAIDAMPHFHSRAIHTASNPKKDNVANTVVT